MIEALKSNEIANKVGGRFKLTVLIQRRLVELLDGARPLVEREGRSDLELVIEEIQQDKIALGWTEEDAAPALASGGDDEPLL
ncbi:MAG: DNA-directed RNA polymerase subunit omega [Planctomycetota bacterium]